MCAGSEGVGRGRTGATQGTLKAVYHSGEGDGMGSAVVSCGDDVCHSQMLVGACWWDVRSPSCFLIVWLARSFKSAIQAN